MGGAALRHPSHQGRAVQSLPEDVLVRWFVVLRNSRGPPMRRFAARQRYPMRFVANWRVKRSESGGTGKAEERISKVGIIWRGAGYFAGGRAIGL